MISRLQSKRMDEQRCEAPILNDISNKPPRQRDTAIPSPNGMFRASYLLAKCVRILSMAKTFARLSNCASCFHHHLEFRLVTALFLLAS